MKAASLAVTVRVDCRQSLLSVEERAGEIHEFKLDFISWSYLHTKSPMSTTSTLRRFHQTWQIGLDSAMVTGNGGISRKLAYLQSYPNAVALMRDFPNVFLTWNSDQGRTITVYSLPIGGRKCKGNTRTELNKPFIQSSV